MADFLGELVPFKDNSSAIDGCHCSIDPRDRLFVCKLDRNDLEDRHLRLLEEVKSLKKLANCQEDKIKRLATKLMRSGANVSRFCIATVDVSDENDKICALEAENSKLKDKVCLLRSQLSNTKIFGRSPSRGRKNLHGSCSGPITCRSDTSRSKAPSLKCISSRDNDVENYLCKIQELEKEKNELSCRVSELENEVASCSLSNNREKVAENVEYIRVWRQMKRQQENFDEARGIIDKLKQENNDLKNLLKQASSDSKTASRLLEAEKKENSKLEETVTKIKESQDDLREQTEAIEDLKSENTILQEHNSKLLEISSKFEKVELENAELKRKLADKLSEQQNFKDVLSKEKANTLSLQAANDQLLSKINDLQKNIDVMTIQLMSKTSKQVTKKKTKKTSLSISAEDISLRENSKVCKKFCDDTTKSKNNLSEKGIQTSVMSTNIIVQTEKPPDSALTIKKTADEMYNENKSKFQLPQNGNSLSRAEMLKLLEQVQISTPLESQNASRIRHTESLAVGGIVPRSNLETLLFGDTSF